MLDLRTVLVANAASRSGRDDFALARDRLLERGVQLAAALEVEDPGRLGDVVDEQLDDGARLVVLAGGDGTVSSVAGRLAAREAVLGLLPTGTANDLARTLGLPTEVAAACDVVADGQVTRIDLGELALADRSQDVLLNLASVGLAVEVTRAVSPTLKRRIGALAYPVAAVRAYFRHQVFSARLEFPDGDHPASDLNDLLQVGIANGRFYGGGAVVAPDADIDDRLLDVYAVPRGSARQRLQVARHFVSGAFIEQDHVLHVKTRAVRLTTTPALPVNVDGELSARTPLDVRIRPHALQVLVPA